MIQSTARFSRVTLGPILGRVSPHDVRVLVELNCAMNAVFSLTSICNKYSQRQTIAMKSRIPQIVEFGKLKPDTTYTFLVEVIFLYMISR